MPTPLKQRTRISLEDKVKLIEDSKRPGFNRKDAMEKYGIGRNAQLVMTKVWQIGLVRNVMKSFVIFATKHIYE